MSENNSPSPEQEIQTRDRIRYQVLIESVFKFRLFFVGFVFAILSFAMQFPAKAEESWIKFCEASAWVFLAFAGYLALKDCGGFAAKITEKIAEGLEERPRKWMWFLFLAGVVLLMLAKILDSFSRN